MLVRHIARPMLGSIFIVAGADGLSHPEASARAAEPLVQSLVESAPESAGRYLPRDPQTYVRIHGALQLAAGLALASGRFPRVSAWVLASTLVPATLIDQAFWRQPDPDLKLQQKTHFWKNISILGGLIIAGIDTEGRPGLSWRTRKAAGDAVAAISSALPGVEPASHSLQAKAAELGEVAREKVPEVAEYARERGAQLADTAQRRGSQLAEIASRRGGELAERISERGADVASAAESSRRRWFTR
ncbi:DoxX family membrane protein [Mycobacteroides saopaulense]|uniref:DoxX family membrane protein n=1 Tax=Mycobacteroides saopaulense TaxID=1578165 RepID=UPI00138EE39B|nr:DoxX family protein [Mycobacteroides saopaulense]